MKQAWWMPLLRGLAAVIFGVMAFIWPGLTVATLVLLFGAFTLVDGVSAAIGAVMNRKVDRYWWLVLLLGAFSILAGIAALVWPDLTALLLLYMIAVRALATGILDIITATQLRKEIEGEWLLVLVGLGSVLFGLFAFFWPSAGALAIIWVIAIYAIIVGVILLVLAFRVRSWGKRLEQLGMR